MQNKNNITVLPYLKQESNLNSYMVLKNLEDEIRRNRRIVQKKKKYQRKKQISVLKNSQNDEINKNQHGGQQIVKPYIFEEQSRKFTPEFSCSYRFYNENISSLNENEYETIITQISQRAIEERLQKKHNNSLRLNHNSSLNDSQNNNNKNTNINLKDNKVQISQTNANSPKNPIIKHMISNSIKDGAILKAEQMAKKLNQLEQQSDFYCNTKQISFYDYIKENKTKKRNIITSQQENQEQKNLQNLFKRESIMKNFMKELEMDEKEKTLIRQKSIQANKKSQNSNHFYQEHSLIYQDSYKQLIKAKELNKIILQNQNKKDKAIQTISKVRKLISQNFVKQQRNRFNNSFNYSFNDSLNYIEKYRNNLNTSLNTYTQPDSIQQEPSISYLRQTFHQQAIKSVDQKQKKQNVNNPENEAREISQMINKFQNLFKACKNFKRIRRNKKNKISNIDQSIERDNQSDNSQD